MTEMSQSGNIVKTETLTNAADQGNREQRMKVTGSGVHAGGPGARREGLISLRHVQSVIASHFLDEWTWRLLRPV